MSNSSISKSSSSADMALNKSMIKAYAAKEAGGLLKHLNMMLVL